MILEGATTARRPATRVHVGDGVSLKQYREITAHADPARWRPLEGLVVATRVGPMGWKPQPARTATGRRFASTRSGALRGNAGGSIPTVSLRGRPGKASVGGEGHRLSRVVRVNRSSGADKRHVRLFAT